jgi:hypothetical protein
LKAGVECDSAAGDGRSSGVGHTPLLITVQVRAFFITANIYRLWFSTTGPVSTYCVNIAAKVISYRPSCKMHCRPSFKIATHVLTLLPTFQVFQHCRPRFNIIPPLSFTVIAQVFKLTTTTAQVSKLPPYFHQQFLSRFTTI